MLLIVGTIRLPAARLDEAKPFMARMVLASRAEPGCLEYSYADDLLDPGLIHVKELWADRAALTEHFQSKHLADWRRAWPSPEIRDRRLALYEVGEPEPT